MEQRNGRIDRKLQPAAEVFCYYFVYEQRPEDHILETVVRKTKTIRNELGSLSQVIDGELEDLLNTVSGGRTSIAYAVTSKRRTSIRTSGRHSMKTWNLPASDRTNCGNPSISSVR